MGNGQEGFNRTFMELKYGLELVEIAEGVVLIVPLWNWNFERVTASDVKNLF